MNTGLWNMGSGLAAAPRPGMTKRGLRRQVWKAKTARTSKDRSHAGCRQAEAVCRSELGRRDRPDLGRIHQDPEQVAELRPRLAGARPYGSGGRAVRALGPGKDRGA